MQHININPIHGKTTATPNSIPVGSMSYPIIEEDFYIDMVSKYWYKRYSDGWIEQGGYISPQTIAAYGNIEVSFPTGRNFTATPLYIECMPYATAAAGGDVGLYGVRNITATGFTYTRGSGTSYSNTGFYWVAKGF